MNTPHTLSRHYRPAPLALALCCALAGIQLAHADLSADAGERARKLDAVQVIANPEDPQSTAGSAYVLTTQELDKFSYTNVKDILRNVPGVYVREEDGMGVFPRIGVRASSSGRSDRISVLEDGIPAAMSPYANTSAYFFSPMLAASAASKYSRVLKYCCTAHRPRRAWST